MLDSMQWTPPNVTTLMRVGSNVFAVRWVDAQLVVRLVRRGG